MRWWAEPTEAVFQSLASAPTGLSTSEAVARREKVGPNEVPAGDRARPLVMLWRQIANPLVLVLVFAAVISALVGEWIDAGVVTTIIVLSSLVGFWREYQASRVLEALRARLSVKAQVVRDGTPIKVNVADVVPGDVLVLAAGSLVAADGLVLEARDFFVSQAALTGETFPVEKRPGPAVDGDQLTARNNGVFFGTHVRSGVARVLVTETGRATELGRIAESLRQRAPETEFDRGLRHFGELLTRMMLVMSIVVLGVNLVAHRPAIESLLFAIALAVGLTPELLPAILAFNLARAAHVMAGQGVLVRRLSAIENFGSMTVLCTDKTGTLTEGVMKLEAAVDLEGRASTRVLELAFANAAHQSGIPNPLDEALQVAGRAAQLPLPPKLDELPYDFVRRRLSVVVRTPTGPQLITKGAVAQVVERCSSLDAAGREKVDAFVEAQGKLGFRVLAVATRALPERSTWSVADEAGLTFEGFLCFADPPRARVVEMVAELQALGVTLKIITGDNVHVAQHLAERVGLPAPVTLRGTEIAALSNEALAAVANQAVLFAEIDPQQKERIVAALKTREVVGYLGDGINDAPALHAADVSISVESAVDVAREAADFVLLAPRLDMLRDGILAGRRTFANTLKYVMTTTSANLGNMVSMAVASLALPFLPLTAGQILLNNFLSDIPAVGVATDSVDDEWLTRPHRWDQHAIQRFMLRFGALSSVFDLLTFGVLLMVFDADARTFRTGWFVESLLTELAVALVLRTWKPAWRSRPGRLLWVSTLVVAVLAVAIPSLPFADMLGFAPMPLPVLGTIIGITCAYVAATEWLKRHTQPPG